PHKGDQIRRIRKKRRSDQKESPKIWTLLASQLDDDKEDKARITSHVPLPFNFPLSCSNNNTAPHPTPSHRCTERRSSWPVLGSQIQTRHSSSSP
uniref:Uncharacterized protein n=1 Tax=Aegilops tauschii subsp. strangulata TaxID=200361 RepID=A0A452XUE9_AEGTS